MFNRILKTVGALIVILILAASIGMVMYQSKDKFTIPEGTKFIAHRGHSSEYYENSEQAFLSAAKSDFFFAIETDIWLTADGVWVCAHDANPFEDESMNIFNITYEHALTLPLKSEKYGHDPTGIRLVSLERYLEICYQYGKMAVIELKYTPQQDEIQELIEFVKSVFPLERTQFISFHQSNIQKIKSVDPSITVQTLSSNLVISTLLINNGENVGINQNIVSDSIIEMAKKKSATLNVWTVNYIDKVKELVEAGVDYITTDYIFEL